MTHQSQDSTNATPSELDTLRAENERLRAALQSARKELVGDDKPGRNAKPVIDLLRDFMIRHNQAINAINAGLGIGKQA
jgi:hypothetical protein